MPYLTVRVTPQCEELIANLPHHYTWGLVSEDYDRKGNGEIVLSCDESIEDDVQEALEANPDVITYLIDED